jgi:hypothetical protein
MKMPSWLNKTKNDDEASSSSSARRRRITSCTAPVLLLRDLPLAPRPEDYVTLPPHVVAAARPRRNHRYVPLDECERWRDGEGIDHNDVSLPTGWHLNRARAPIQPGAKLTTEIRRRIRDLPEPLHCERKYQNEQFWYDFLGWDAHRPPSIYLLG